VQSVQAYDTPTGEQIFVFLSATGRRHVVLPSGLNPPLGIRRALQILCKAGIDWWWEPIGLNMSENRQLRHRFNVGGGIAFATQHGYDPTDQSVHPRGMAEDKLVDELRAYLKEVHAALEARSSRIAETCQPTVNHAPTWVVATA